ncbi:MAG: RNA polymerase factor sigma-32 [Stellaceae bacterium]
MDRADDPLTRRANLDFIRASMRAPLLSREHEFALARRWREERDVAALHEFVRAYTRFVIAIAARFRNYGLAMGDLVQEGNVGLMQAALRFEPERDIRFSTYAAWWIRSAMQDYILRNWSIVRTGTTAAQKALFFNLRRLRARIADLSGGVMSREARQKIADELQVSLADVEMMEMRLGAADQSLNAPLRADGEDDRQDLIADARANPEEVLIGQRDSAARSRWLAQALRELTPREQRIIRRRRLSEKGTTLEALGRELGVSKERVRQLEHRALSKLKTAIERRVEVKADLLPG